MPQHNHAQTRICPDCFGFASVAIATGARHRDGTRQTIPVHCSTCAGLGSVARPRVPAIANAS
ncbi:hypothetical protein [Kitasatospora azatica]|uniref:hypothetical protein n=1 Tax=Kitasatospora azatica TaxID=58347 RepID=UPI00056D505B|nr:hypothetical protein [Kitasatospora azatica]